MNDRSEQLRRRFLDVPIVLPPAPWRRAHPSPEIGIGGLMGVGFGTHLRTRGDLLLVLSHGGRGVFDCANAELLARDYDVDENWPEGPELRCGPSKAGHLVKAIAVLQNHRVAQTIRE